MNDALWKYVGQISGVLSICGAVVVIITAIVLTEINRIFRDHITTAEVTWASFLAGVEVAGAISIAYGIALNRKKAGGGDENRQAFIAFFSGIALIIVATAGFTVPTSGGDTAHAHPKRSHAQNNQRLCVADQPRVRCPAQCESRLSPLVSSLSVIVPRNAFLTRSWLPFGFTHLPRVDRLPAGSCRPVA